MKKRTFFAVLIALMLFSCRDNTKPIQAEIAVNETVSNNIMRYAQNVSVVKTNMGYYVDVSNPWKAGESLGKFLFAPDTIVLPDRYHCTSDTIIVTTPVKSVVSFSATQWSVFMRLGEIDKVKCILEGGYVNNTEMRHLLEEGKVIDVGTEHTADIEKIVESRPDIILYSPYFDQSSDAMKRVGAVMFPYADYIENTPLGRAEWIKIVGLLTGKLVEADAWFSSIEQRYNSLCSLCDSVSSRPTVFSDLAFNGQWYVAGGKSYIARLFADAGADYVWKDNNSTASVPLDAETILLKAQKADYWRITNSATTPMTFSSLAMMDRRYTLFDAYKKHNILVCDIIPTGYFEQSQVEPDVLLADFIYFFHKELLTGEWHDYEPKYYHLMTE